MKLKDDNSDCENKFNDGHLQNDLVYKIVFYSLIEYIWEKCDSSFLFKFKLKFKFVYKLKFKFVYKSLLSIFLFLEMFVFLTKRKSERVIWQYSCLHQGCTTS